MAGASTQRGQTQSWAPARVGRTEVRLVLLAAMVASAALGLWFSRNTTFSVDEFRVFIDSAHVDLHELLEPFNGHLILTTRLLYAAFCSLGAVDQCVAVASRVVG